MGALAFGEPEAATAARLMAAAELRAPKLLPFEVLSIARKKVLKHPELGAAIRQGLRLALSLDVRLVEVAHAEVLELALARGVSTYDAAYLWVALRSSGELLTFDRRLKEAAAGTARPRRP